MASQGIPSRSRDIDPAVEARFRTVAERFPSSVVSAGPVLIGITALFLIAAAAMVAYSEWGRRSPASAPLSLTLEDENRLLTLDLSLSEAHRSYRQAVLSYLLTGRSRDYRDVAVREAALRQRVQALAEILRNRSPDGDRATIVEAELNAYLTEVGVLIAKKRKGLGFRPADIPEVLDSASARADQRNVIAEEFLFFSEARARRHAEDVSRRAARELTYKVIAVGLVAAAIVLISASLREIIRWRSLARSMSVVNRELEEARNAAEEANAAKGHFITTISHDIRQPLHAINLYLDILSRRLKDTGAESVVERIGLAAASMSRMSRQLLDLSRYDASGYVPGFRGVPLDPVIQAVITDSTPLAWGAGVKLRAARTSLVALADPALVESVLRNLVWNAILYTPGGNVLVGVRRDPVGVRIEVYDNGPGLPQDKADFLRGVLPSRSIPLRPDGKGGLGLGLSIVKRGAELLGGELEVRSQPGRTRFALRLPVADPTS